MAFTAEELEEMRLADEEIERNWKETPEDYRQNMAASRELDRLIKLDRLDNKAKGAKRKTAEYQRQYREANRDAIAEYHRQYYKANKDAIAEHQRQYREANRDAIAEYQRRDYEANRDAIAGRKRERRDARRTYQKSNTHDREGPRRLRKTIKKTAGRADLFTR